MLQRRILCAWVLSACLSGSGRARAGELVVSSDSSCGTTDGLASRVALLLGSSAIATSELHFSVVVASAPAGEKLRAQVTPSRGRTPLEARSIEALAHECPALLDAAALMIAISIDPMAIEKASALASGAASSGKASLKDQSPLTPKPIQERAVVEEPSFQSTVYPRGGRVFVGGTVTGGSVGVGWGPEGGVGARWQNARVDAGVRYLLPRSLSVIGGEVTVSEWDALVRMCWVPGFGIALCGKALAGQLLVTGEASAVRRGKDASAFVARLGPALSYGITLGAGFSVHASAHAVFTLSSVNLLVGEETVYSVGPVEGGGGVTAGWEF